MKKIMYVLFAFVISLGIIGRVNATDYTYRTTKDGKAVVYKDGVPLYVSVSLLFDMNGASASTKMPVSNITAKLEDEKLYITVKRSEINKVLKENSFNNVYSLLEVNMDYLDLDSNKKYYYFRQNDVNKNLYYYTTKDEDYLGRNYNIMEILSSAFNLVGTISGYHSIGGGFLLFEADDYGSFEFDSKITREEIVTNDKMVVGIEKRVVYVDVIEDEQINLGDNTTIISPSGTVNPDTGDIELNQVIDINNFYGEYFENQKLKYSWTVYDKDGSPVELNVNTSIKFDDSENEDAILSNFGNEFANIKDRIKIISFEHEGEIGGTAKVSLYVGDKFEPNSILTLYYYNPEKEALENPDWGSYDEYVDKTHDKYEVLVDNDGYITIELTHCSEYVLVPKDIEPINKESVEVENKENVEKKSNKNVLPFIGIGTLFVIFVGSISFIILKKKRKSKKIEENKGE